MTFEQMLGRYAEVTVRVGLNLAVGQELVILAPIEAQELVRLIAVESYRAGASNVTPIFEDQALLLAKFQNAQDASFDAAPTWLFGGVAEALRSGAARLWIIGEDPELLALEDAARVSRANESMWLAKQQMSDIIGRSLINWCVIGHPVLPWARTVFPTLDDEKALQALWQAVFAAARLEGPDPVTGWKNHCLALHKRTTYLDERRYSALRFSGPSTDLTVGLMEQHRWIGGATRAANGIEFVANIPTEEVFTAPHKERTVGTVISSRPLYYNGVSIDGIKVRFEKGEVVAASATSGEEALHSLLATDDGARRLGEVALVSHSNPISQSGFLFAESLFDENAASHIAFGRCYRESIHIPDATPDDTLFAAGANDSLVHVDWMIGSGDMDVDGVLQSGKLEPIMRNGEWAD